MTGSRWCWVTWTPTQSGSLVHLTCLSMHQIRGPLRKFPWVINGIFSVVEVWECLLRRKSEWKDRVLFYVDDGHFKVGQWILSNRSIWSRIIIIIFCAFHFSGPQDLLTHQVTEWKLKQWLHNSQPKGFWNPVGDTIEGVVWMACGVPVSTPLNHTQIPCSESVLQSHCELSLGWFCFWSPTDPI